MNTITAILEPEPDGTLRLPVPEEFKSRKVKVIATFEEPEQKKPRFKVGCLKGFWIAPDFDEPLEEFKEYME